MTPPVAAVDVGTNSVRLLVAREGAGGNQAGENQASGNQAGGNQAGGEHLTTVERLMTITRLGKGVDARGHLDDAALARTLDCLEDYARRWESLGAQRVRIAATSAVRDAADRERFFDGVRERTGVVAEVISGQEEALLAFRGAVSSVEGAAPYLVLDIGGGSTELILGEAAPTAADSLQVGCVRLTERCLHDDPPVTDQLAAGRAVVAAELDSLGFDPEPARTLIGVAGTVTTIGALHLELETYEPERIHGTRVPVDGVAALTQRLAAMTSQQRAGLGPMAAGREDVIVAGCLILEAVLRRYHFAEVLVSEADILDGLALSLLDG
ncbi:Ppx/GppA phosphatase family protein [soil metagenome]|jgi:exopolyphosphatase/guanosine-5'-triphosphate,3'-diphosphate pyrophosphatase